MYELTNNLNDVQAADLPTTIVIGDFKTKLYRSYQSYLGGAIIAQICWFLFIVAVTGAPDLDEALVPGGVFVALASP